MPAGGEVEGIRRGFVNSNLLNSICETDELYSVYLPDPGRSATIAGAEG